jgi:hypothetical protein
MRITEENWKVLASFLPTGWQQMAWQSGAIDRLRGFPSPDVLLRTLMIHVARGYSLRETVVRAKLDSATISNATAVASSPSGKTINIGWIGCPSNCFTESSSRRI